MAIPVLEGCRTYEALRYYELLAKYQVSAESFDSHWHAGFWSSARHGQLSVTYGVYRWDLKDCGAKD
jgi:hypothetical protein